MITVCWAVKGGSGTTTISCIVALAGARPTLLVDLDGEVHTALGCPLTSGPGVLDWVASEAPCDHLSDLLVDLGHGVALLPQPTVHAAAADLRADGGAPRWEALGAWLSAWSEREGGAVVVDAGTGIPPAALVDHATHRLLITRPCYLSLRRSSRSPCRPTGVVLVREAGRPLGPRDVETSVGAPVVASIDVDPTVARALDSGLLAWRVPRTVRRQLQRAAA